MNDARDNMPGNLNFVLFEVPDDGDKLHLARIGFASANMVLDGLARKTERTFLYLVTPTTRYGTLGIYEQSQVSTNGKDLDALHFPAARLWRYTVSKAYEQAAATVAALFPPAVRDPVAHAKLEQSVYRRLRRMELDPHGVFLTYVQAMRAYRKCAQYDQSTVFLMAEKLAIMQSALSSHHYAFLDYRNADVWPLTNTIATRPEDERYSLFKAKEIGKINIGIAVVLAR